MATAARAARAARTASALARALSALARTTSTEARAARAAQSAHSAPLRLHLAPADGRVDAGASTGSTGVSTSLNARALLCGFHPAPELLALEPPVPMVPRVEQRPLKRKPSGQKPLPGEHREHEEQQQPDALEEQQLEEERAELELEMKSEELQAIVQEIDRERVGQGEGPRDSGDSDDSDDSDASAGQLV